MQRDALDATVICSCSSAYRRFRLWLNSGLRVATPLGPPGPPWARGCLFARFVQNVLGKIRGVVLGRHFQLPLGESGRVVEVRSLQVGSVKLRTSKVRTREVGCLQVSVSEVSVV